MAYATVEQLAAALRLTVTAKNQDALQSALDAAAEQIDHYCDRPSGDPIASDDPLAMAVNIAYGIDLFKAADFAGGAIGFADIGVVRASTDPFARHAAALTPLKVQFGIA